MTGVMDFRYYYITSDNQLSATNNVFTTALDIPEGRFNRITLVNLNIPVSFYVIQNGHNTFYLTENSTSVLITIPQGNYNINSFITGLTSLLNLNSPNGLTYTLSFPNTYTQTSTGKITLSKVVLIFPLVAMFMNNLVSIGIQQLRLHLEV